MVINFIVCSNISFCITLNCYNTLQWTKVHILSIMYKLYSYALSDNIVLRHKKTQELQLCKMFHFHFISSVILCFYLPCIWHNVFIVSDGRSWRQFFDGQVIWFLIFLCLLLYDKCPLKPHDYNEGHGHWIKFGIESSWEFFSCIVSFNTGMHCRK